MPERQQQQTAQNDSPAAQQQANVGFIPPARFRMEKPAENKTGMTNQLKSGLETLSGFDLSDVRVHYNSPKPAQLHALAYAQGNDIHVGPGQDMHVAHEGWHVVQQRQGRVQPTTSVAGVAVNDNTSLETEADVMGGKAMQMNTAGDASGHATGHGSGKGVMQQKVVQRLAGFEFETQWDLQKPPDTAWNSTTVIVPGNGWAISPDEIDGNNAKIEFKTKPFNVDNPSVEAAREDIDGTFASLDKYVSAYLLPMGDGEDRLLPTAKTAMHGIHVIRRGELTAKPQVTGGVRTDLLLDFLNDAASQRDTADLMPGEGRKAVMQESLNLVNPRVDQASKASKEYGGLIVLLSYYIRRFQQDKVEYDAAVEELKTELRQQLTDYRNAEVRSPEQITQKKAELETAFEARSEELRRQHAPTYAKARASVLPRIAFNDLPGVTNEHLLRDVLRASGLTNDDRGRDMFPLRNKDNDDGYEETIEEWITSIRTPRAGPDDEGELWSERALQSGDVGMDDKTGTGIPFELRSMPGELPYADWREFAIPYLSYFRRLNKKAKPAEE